jgi:hypothetical protein
MTPAAAVIIALITALVIVAALPYAERAYKLHVGDRKDKRAAKGAGT